MSFKIELGKLVYNDMGEECVVCDIVIHDLEDIEVEVLNKVNGDKEEVSIEYFYSDFSEEFKPSLIPPEIGSVWLKKGKLGIHYVVGSGYVGADFHLIVRNSLENNRLYTLEYFYEKFIPFS